MVTLLAAGAVIAILIITANEDRREEERRRELMTRWGVDRQLIDTSQIDEIISLLEDVKGTLRNLIDDLHAINGKGLYIGINAEDCENAISDTDDLIDEYETAEAAIEDRYTADNTDFK